LDFDLKALYDALDTERRTRALTWTQVAREINDVGPIRVHPVATSTITGLRSKSVAEADGVLQMLRWLGRAPESFIRGLPQALADATLPAVETRKVLRFDTKMLYESLDGQRRTRGFTWKDVAAETGTSESHIRTLKNGGRTVFPGVMRLTTWLQQPASRFTRVSVY
jgi:hypothetical protein